MEVDKAGAYMFALCIKNFVSIAGIKPPDFSDDTVLNANVPL